MWQYHKVTFPSYSAPVSSCILKGLYCNTRFLKIICDSAEIFDFKTFPHMLSKRWNRFRVCSASDEIVSGLGQHAFGCPCKNATILTLAEHTQKFVRSRLSVRWDRFQMLSNDEIIATYAHIAQPVHATIFVKYQKSPIKMLFLTINNRNFVKLSSNLSIGPKWTSFHIPHNKKFVLRMLSHRRNARKTKFW